MIFHLTETHGNHTLPRSMFCNYRGIIYNKRKLKKTFFLRGTDLLQDNKATVNRQDIYQTSKRSMRVRSIRSKIGFENHTFSLGIDNLTIRAQTLLEIPSFRLSDVFSN